MQKKDRPEKTQKRAKFLLDLITMATRALRIHEIQGALSIRLGDQSLDFERRKSQTPLEDLLGPIVEVHADKSVDLIHPTAKASVLLVFYKIQKRANAM